jgi:DNA-binding HxlR family transcriptional regulator
MWGMPDYGRYCPIALGTEVVSDRWTPLILRELILGNTRFNDIARGLPGISRSLLTQRLRHLERNGVVELWPAASGRGNEYHLTPAGKDLESVVMGLGRWAVEWLYDEMEPQNTDPTVLIWWMHRRIDAAELPASRAVVEFVFTAPERATFWMVFEHGEVSVCLQHPGFEPDVMVTTTTAALAAVFQGLESWKHALATGAIRIEGATSLARALPRWFLGSPFTELTQDRAARAGRDPIAAHAD